MQLHKIINKKTSLLLITAFIPFIFIGCAGAVIEVRDRAFVQAIGIDGNSEPSVTLSIFNNSDYEEHDTYTGTGKTIFEAIANAESQQEKNLFIGHIELIALAEGNIKERLIKLLVNNKIAPGSQVIFAVKDAKGVLKNKNATELVDNVKIMSKNGIISQRSLSVVLDDMLGFDKAAAIPITDGENFSMGIIDETDLITELSKEESEGLSWLSGTIKTLTMPVETDGQTVNVRVNNVKSRVRSKIVDDKITTTFNITFNADVLDKNYTIEQIKSMANEKIISQCESAVIKTVNMLGTDVLNIEKSIKSANFDYYLENKDNWQEMLKSIDFEYNLNWLK